MNRLVSGWGRSPRVETAWLDAHTAAEAGAACSSHHGMIARGNGRAYGDAAVGTRVTLAMGGLDRMIAFDAATGLLRAEAGVLLGDIIAAFLPRGWFPFVVPGTRFVTLGGAIAADVHGKNHHGEGGFGRYVEALVLAMPDGSVKTASRAENPVLFHHTIGGMGLTGTLLEATIRLRPVETGWVRQQTLVAHNLDEALRALDAADAATYSVAWIDCLARGPHLGRSLVYRGEHARRAELEGRTPFPALKPPRLGVPFDLPALALSRLSVTAFNELYFRMGARKAGRSFLVPVGPYFFPLDGVHNWNRIYGRRGFVQHQCVLPPANAGAALAEMLGIITKQGNASFLAVLKKLGASQGTLSFPLEGYTLALDFPVAPGLEAFLSQLDAVVTRAQGRLYLAKDSRQSRATFDAGYPAAEGFRAFRRDNGLAPHLSSHLSNRLGL
jgi:decaprenylphospho-beta-D-ribofuranose 2-oxidase